MTPLRALLVEDNERDAELLLRELKRNYSVQHVRVDTADALKSALGKQGWDVILSDYDMQGFDARAAHALMIELGHDLPFIIISGTVEETTAIDAMHAGAHDYFVKGKLGPRLMAAIEREVRESKIRAERKAMHEQLMISDRMVSMGTLAAGVAHEINNPLAAVIANLDLAVGDIADKAAKLGVSSEFVEIREELEDARVAARRIRDIIRDLKIFSRSDDDKKDAVEIRAVLESTLRMAWNEIRHRAKLVKNYGETPLVEASESRLGQVFLNIVVNAAQAIPEGRAATNEIRVATSTDDEGRAVIEISDTGHGMPSHVLNRLFTPFFTTKPVGVGTGLGLSICHRIITSLGGTIEVRSKLEQGTSFRIALPPAPDVTRARAASPTADDGAARRRGKILCIDDEPSVAKAVERTLATDHDVVTVSAAEDALRRIKQGERFDVILCDLMMPQMTGMDLHAELVRVAADQAAKMVFLTGGAFTAQARAFLDKTINTRIEKPFVPADLKAMINKHLDAH